MNRYIFDAGYNTYLNTQGTTSFNLGFSFQQQTHLGLWCSISINYMLIFVSIHVFTQYNLQVYQRLVSHSRIHDVYYYMWFHSFGAWNRVERIIELILNLIEWCNSMNFGWKICNRGRLLKCFYCFYCSFSFNDTCTCKPYHLVNVTIILILNRSIFILNRSIY